MTVPAASAASFATEGLRTDQAPPLAIPASFFALAPLAMAATGILLSTGGMGVVAQRQVPLAMAGTHLATLGFLGSLMLGALYQMTPVVAGAPVPVARIAHGVHVAWVTGAGALVFAFATGTLGAFRMGQGLLAVALLAFIAPVAFALLRAPTRGETVMGMRLALAGLAALATLGLLMAEARTTGRLVGGGDWISWATAHASLGGLVWIGGLVTAVSWQVVPMFYLAPALPVWSRRLTVAALALTLVAAPVALFMGAVPRTVALTAAPAAVMVWLVHPILALRAIRRRRRRRSDASLSFWRAGLLCAPVVFALAVAAALADHPRWATALGFVALWGWAGLIAHGMSSRIIPFLVWFHRFAPLVGERPVPTMRQILPDARVRLALGLHGGAVVVGGIAIAGGVDVLVRATGGLLVAAAIVMAANLVRALARRS